MNEKRKAPQELKQVKDDQEAIVSEANNQVTEAKRSFQKFTSEVSKIKRKLIQLSEIDKRLGNSLFLAEEVPIGGD